jgi:hypothetical protein
MKILFTTIYTLFFLLTSVKAKECVYTYETKPEESKYTKQFSIDTDREGHSVRIFSLESTYKDKKKNCEGLSLVKSYNWDTVTISIKMVLLKVMLHKYTAMEVKYLRLLKEQVKIQEVPKILLT